MSNPSFSNIDMWLFELAEGNLSPEQVEQLELFLLNHPELDVERDVWEMAKVEKTPVAYPEVASLERKRRPVVAFAFAGLFLFLIGTGSFMVWNGQFDSFSEADAQAQNDQVKSQLLEQIRDLQNQTKNQNSSEEVGKYLALGKLSLNNVNEFTNSGNNGIVDGVDNTETNGSQIAIASLNANGTQNGSPINANSTNSASNRLNQTIDPSLFELTHTITAQTQNTTAQAQSLAESVTNPQDQSYDTELSDRLGNSDEVGEKDFYVRQPREIEVYEGRVWNERKTAWAGRTIASSGNSRKSFKDRFNKFTRSLERMMNSPIALKNSRDPHYHVPGMTSNDINFSSAGTLIATRVQTNSRLQWQGQANEQLMNQISADGYSYGMRGGWGVQLNHQLYQNGGIQVGQAAFTYSPKISVSNWVSVEPSVRLKMGNKRLNSELMESTDAVEMDRGNAREFYANGAAPIGRSLWYKDVGLGLLVNTKWFFAGVQVDNLFKYKDNLYDDNWSDPRRVQNHFTATIGSDWVSRNEKLSLSPYLVYQKNENLSEVWGGANFAYKWFNVGMAVSNNLEPAASIGMKFDHFSLHYNADYTQSMMLDKKALSHQLTIRFVAKKSSFNKRLFKR
ncbi:MAG: type IX secretion system membrane protein PorP/SprF [Crocinitomicaceae bacterium]|nr:type IX secretion system membrane protein PorP/SprF [Crocinitomicaceae bacterium]